MRAVIALAAVAGCSGDTYLVVTVNARTAVQGATTLKVTEQNAGTMRTDTLPLGTHGFPVTFSVSAPGRTGELDLSIEAHAADDSLVGLGTSITTLGKDASLMLDSADFVVNTDFANDQYLSTDFESNGLQLAAAGDGSWTASYGSTCTAGCTVFGRRFDANGVALRSVVAAGTNGFPLSTTETTSLLASSVAASGVNTMAFWEFTDTVGMPAATGVACRQLDEMGNATPGQLAIETAETADVVTSTPLSNGNFAASWQIYTPSSQIHTIIVRPDCSRVIANPVAVSQMASATSNGPHRSHVATNMDKVLYAWVIDDDVHVRPANNGGAFSGNETTFATHTMAMAIESVRIAPLGPGFAVVVRSAANDGTSPGKIELYRATPTGAVMGTPTLITKASGSSFADGFQAFGVATRPDGALLITWHQCVNGAAGTCNVYARIVRPTGVPVGDPFVVPTTSRNDRLNPSATGLPGAFAVAWNDASMTPPDTSGTAVRARIVYPPYDDATAILGAPCGGSLPACAAGLVCAPGSDNMQRCYEACMPPSCPDGGTCTMVGATTYACTY